MSRIPDLGTKYANLPGMIHEYDTELSEAAKRLSIRGKNLDVALQEQCAWPLFYDVKRAELKTLVKYFDSQKASVRGMLTRKFKENYSRDIGDRMTEKYIDNEPDYLQIHGLCLEIEEIYDQYNAVMDAFKVRGFALRDLTEAKVASIHNSLI